MHRLQDQITRSINHCALLLRIATPQHIDNTLLALGNKPHHRIGKSFPASSCVRSCLVRPDGQNSVEHQHSLFRPAVEISTQRHGLTHIISHLLEDIAQRWRKIHSIIHREAQAIGLSVSVIGILTDNHHLQVIEWAFIEGTKYISRSRKYLARGVLRLYKIDQLRKVGFIKLLLQQRFPIFRNSDIHSNIVFESEDSNFQRNNCLLFQIFHTFVERTSLKTDKI